MLLALIFPKPRSRANRFAVDGVGDARHCSTSQRHPVGGNSRLPHPVGVTTDHLEVGKHVMSEQHRLSALDVRVAGHHDTKVF